MNNSRRFRYCAVKINMSHSQETLDGLKKIWSETFPDNVFAYHFLDERIENFYELDNIMLKLIEVFAAIAIFIACLGLYGLVSFMAVQRTKEVGIRKVLGASARHIVYLMSREFTLLIIIAFAISAPVGYYIMHKWLQNYTYRIPLSVSIFLLAVVGSIVIAWITAGQRAIKSALANPVKSLRTE